MFLIPYDFIEDFFIIYNVFTSLKNEVKTNYALEQLNGYGLNTGIGHY